MLAELVAAEFASKKKRQCTTEGCENFGNKQNGGVCNACYKKLHPGEPVVLNTNPTVAEEPSLGVGGIPWSPVFHSLLAEVKEPVFEKAAQLMSRILEDLTGTAPPSSNPLYPLILIPDLLTPQLFSLL
jgi:hypothetical protein